MHMFHTCQESSKQKEGPESSHSSLSAIRFKAENETQCSVSSGNGHEVKIINKNLSLMSVRVASFRRMTAVDAAEKKGQSAEMSEVSRGSYWGHSAS